ncbi:MAG TPA: UDP-N-acetylmuramoyl-L-alanine--D-glutamate ligase [Gemmatimonadaceae bacterium]|nr:UDP-N-acetylmuramoyl-L-alanine--D-glutamate ligase [Gemmatimonadaceae bacterium]
MTEEAPPGGEIAVLGLGKSGTAVTRLLLSEGRRVYASDSGASSAASENAEKLKALGADAVSGLHDLERIASASLVVVSPGIPPEAPPLRAASDARVPIVSEIEIALRHLTSAKIVAVTGTNGKTTTTALVGHILRGLGVDAEDGGNIGTPLTEIALRNPQPEWIALEMSSFQLHDTPSLAPTVGVLTNLSPDHLDRYAGEAEYYADKALLFANAGESSRWVVNADDDRVQAMTAEVSGSKYGFSLERRSEACFDPATGKLMLYGNVLMERNELGLLGDHNVANALAAALAVHVADEGFQSLEARERIRAALAAFRPLSHRLEIVGEFGGVQWINDSKATNVSSTRVAVEGMRRPTILLLGGRHKGEPYTSLSAAIRKNVKHVVAYGEAGAEVEKDLSGIVPLQRVDADFEEVIRRARELATPGDAILLSPACSSYDMFRNYEERGARFRELAAEK